MKISLIVAISENNAIGKDNQLLWHIRDDLQLFKRTTLNHVIIMGRKSYESIGKPLPKRTTVIITRQSDYQVPGTIVFNSLERALEYFKGKEDVVFITGGGEIYKQSMPYVNEMHISHVKTTVDDADTFFAEVDYSEWQVVEEETYEASEVNEHGFTYKRYLKAD